MKTRLTKPDDFSGSMLYCLKTILSYYEKKKERILSDYLFYIGIPLMIVFADQKCISIFLYIKFILKISFFNLFLNNLKIFNKIQLN